MRVRVPEYYDHFVCLANECPDTCCGGWNISIDEASYHAYRKVKGSFGRRLRWGIDHRHRRFRLRGRLCTFLNDEGFCDIYKELGREHMCRGCRDYPRHMEDYGELREIMLSLSCPEAARLILTDETQGQFRSIERSFHGEDAHGSGEGQEAGHHEHIFGHDIGHTPIREHLHGKEFRTVRDHASFIWHRAAEMDTGLADVDTDRLECLEVLRQVMICILKDRSIGWKQRLAMMLALSHDVQREWERVSLLSRRYLSPHAAEKFAERLRPYRKRDTERMVRMAAWMRLSDRMEPVLEHWHSWQEEICRDLYHKQHVADYTILERRFAQESMEHEKHWENLILYFLNTYLLGAIYDGDVYSKVKMAVYSTLIIREWCLHQFLITGHFSTEDLIRASYRFSRQVENSDRNLEELEHQFRTNPLFDLSSMMTVLAGERG